MARVVVPFGEWAPDLDPRNGTHATVATGVIPAEGAYRPLPDLSQVGTATLTARCQGARAFYDEDGNPALYAGDATKLYLRTGDTVADKSGSTYTITSGERWEFEQFGANIVATNIDDGPQSANINTAGNFSALGGTPPKARYIARVRDFLFLGNLNESGTLYPSRVRWSAVNDITSWTASAATQADYQDMTEGAGPVQKIVGREFATIFQSRAITRATYAGPPVIFDFDVLEQGRGAITGGGVVDIGNAVLFWSEEGLCVWDNQTAVPIGDKRVNRYLTNRLNYGSRNLMSSAIDYRNKIAVIAYPAGSFSIADSLLIWSWADNRFSHDEINIEAVFSTARYGYTLEELDTFGALDALPYSLDSASWQGGQQLLGAFNSSHQLCTFSGNPRAATLETAEFMGDNGRRSYVSEVRPLVDTTSGTITAQVATRDQKNGDTLTWGSASNQNDAGYCPVRADGRLIRARVSVPSSAQWTHATGIEANLKASGFR